MVDRVVVPVFAEVAGLVEVSPKALFVGTCMRESAVSRTLIIKHPYEPMTIGEITATRGIEIERQESKEQSSGRIRLLTWALRMPSEVGPLVGSLKIGVTVGEREGTISVQVVGQITDGPAKTPGSEDGLNH